MAASEHPLFTTPDDKYPIWRYMDFTKFVSMLASSGVYFSRADLLGDPFEGSFSAANKGLERPSISSSKQRKTSETACPTFTVNAGSGPENAHTLTGT